MQNTELLEYLTYIVAIIAKSPDLAGVPSSELSEPWYGSKKIISWA